MARKKAQKPMVEQPTEKAVQNVDIMDLFSRKPERGVTIMTKEASMHADATRPVTVPKGPSNSVTTFKKKKK